MSGRLAGKRALVTAGGNYMGPAITKRFREEGCEVITHCGNDMSDVAEPARILADAGEIDILVVNLPYDHEELLGGLQMAAEAESEEHWHEMFDTIVHPTMRFVSAVLPQMIARKSGKIIVVTSAAPLRGPPTLSAYCAARAAQNAYVASVGREVAPHNIQVNAVAQHFTLGGFPEGSDKSPRVQAWLDAEVPTRRLARSDEQASLCLFLASAESDFFVGEVFPFAGGWTGM